MARCRNCAEVVDGVVFDGNHFDFADPYAQCKELDDWDLYAVDGHYHKAACFDPKSISSKGELRAIATGHFFRMNMRTHHMSCLGMANPEDGKKKAHDMTVIKRSSADHPGRRKFHQHRAHQSHTEDPAFHTLGAGLDLQTRSLGRLCRPSKGSLGRNLFIVFHTDHV